MKKIIVKKGLVIAVILLFIAISFQPIIAKDAISPDIVNTDNFIEITTKNEEQNKLDKITVEYFGLTQYKNNTFYLTKVESDRFYSIYNEFNNSIHKANSMIEMETIYIDTLNNLSEIGIVNSTEVIEDFNSAKKIYSNIDYGIFEKLTTNENLEFNFLPFIALRANFANFLPPSVLFLIFYALTYIKLKEKFPIFFKIYEKIVETLFKIFVPNPYSYYAFPGLLAFLIIYFLWVYFINPFPIGYSVSLSYENQKNSGWVHAVGLLGIQDITGEYQGALAGFTGLRIFKDSDFFMYGIALASVLGE